MICSWCRVRVEQVDLSKWGLGKRWVHKIAWPVQVSNERVAEELRREDFKVTDCILRGGPFQPVEEGVEEGTQKEGASD